MVSTIATATFTAIPIDTDVAIPVRQHMDKNKKRTRRRRQGHNSLQVLFLAFLLLLACVTTAKKDPDLYEILGVKKTATTKEIKKAYRKKALDTHPDKRKDIPAEQAAEEFHKVVHAFEILSDESSRKTYDRTGRAQPNEGGRGGNQQQQQWGGGFQFHFRQGGGSYRSRQWRLKDQFKVQEAMSRVMHIVSLTQLETVMLDDNDVLERNLLMVFVTPQGVEENVDDEICFPYPFAAMSEQGLWWEDKLQTVKIRYNKQNALTKFFGIPHGDELRKSGKAVFVFARRGEPLEAKSFSKLTTSSREVFEKWVWKELEVTVEFVNNHTHRVELLWMHGSRGSTKMYLEPGETTVHTTMLTHEWWVRDDRVDRRKDSPGRYRLSAQSMVARWKITSDEKFQRLIIHPKTCIDLSGHCPFWDSQRECRKNPTFMAEVCPLTCKLCKEDEDQYKSHDEL